MFEKKNGKRFLASVMALVMLLSLAPVSALAAPGEGPGGWPGEGRPGGSDAGTSASTNVHTYFQTVNTQGEEVTISGVTATQNEHGWGTLGRFATEQSLANNVKYTDPAESAMLGIVGAEAIEAFADDEDLLHQSNKDIASQILGNIEWISLHQYHGADDYEPAENFVWHLDGRVTAYSVTYEAGAEDVTNLPTDNNYYMSGTSYTVSDETPSRDGYVFTGWKSSDGDKDYNAGDTFNIPSDNVVLTAQWTKEEPTVPDPEPEPEPDPDPDPATKTDAMYFVLLPNRGTPKNNADQGEANYLPSSKYDGGVGDLTQNTGYLGYLTEEGMNALSAETSKSITDTENGVSGSYLEVPSNLGFFTPGNWNGSSYDRDKTKTTVNDDTIKSLLGENFNVNGIQIVWYTIKDQRGWGKGIHVDGYIKNVEINVTYHSNFGTAEPYTDKTTTGTNYSALSYEATNLPKRDGYTFAGWCTDKSCTKDYETGVLMSDLHLYAKWEKIPETYTVIFDANGGSWAESVEQKAEQYAEKSTLVTPPTENPEQNGYVFVGWTYQNENGTYEDITTFEGATVGRLMNLPKASNNSITLYAKWEEAQNDQVTYTIHQHFMKDKTTEDGAINYYNNATQKAEVGTQISKLIPSDLINEATRYSFNKNEYLYEEAKIGSTPYTGDETLTENGTEIHLYYYLDSWKDAEMTEDTSDKDSKTGGDGIPDCDQVLIEYVSSNSERGTVSPDMEVLTIRKGNETFVPTANGSTATTTGSSRNYFSNWTKDNTQVSTNATLDHQTILGVIKEFTGGETYIFTANFGRSSGGSSRPSTPPTVDIPDDDVPTGLNGADHYAYIIGYGNNDVRPQQSITRAEVATIFFRLLTDETREANMTKNQNYSDVKDSDWYCRAVATLSSMGIIKGYNDGTFQPNAPITRAEFAAIAARFDPDGDTTPATFSDVGSHWAKDEISIAANHGWINGYEDGTFKPDRNITRAEAVTLINRVLNRLPETKEDLHEDMKTWVDNMDETAWYYLAIQEATNGHYNTNKEGTQYETWTDLRENRDWSELEK